jgi:hypothetical protein
VISKLIGEGADAANDLIVDDAKSAVDDLKALLVGPKRKPIDLEKARAAFVRGEVLSTPDGKEPAIPSSPNAPGSSAPPKSSRFELGRTIELVHFGRVHRDVARAFHAPVPVDDTATLDGKTSPGRAVPYRAALEREAVLLAAITKAVTNALAEKERAEGGLGDLMKLAADLVGGAGGTAGSAASADMKAFDAKIGQAWDAINRADIEYAALHDAGTKLHEVRASLTAYLLEQLGKPSAAAAAAPGILSDLPLVGALPLPGAVGQVVSTFRKVGGKLHDVSNAMIFGLTVAMQPAIESACHTLSLDGIKQGRSPIYPLWALPPDPAAAEKEQKKLADLDVGDPLQGDLKKIGALQKINDAVKGAVDDGNAAVNDATKKPMELIEFLSKEVKPAPGHRYLDAAFQAATGPASALGGSEKLAEIAVASFYSALSDDVPAFMHGFVQDFVGYVFAVCVEFLRSTYRVLCSLPGATLVSTRELVAAGSTHVLTHLVDFLTAKLGLDDLLKDLSVPIPRQLPSLPGIHWPEGNLGAAPIAAELKKLLIDKAAPFLAPVVEFSMSGLARRLNAHRAWAGPSAMTMEAHLGQLPAELALMFRDLFGPMWTFLTDTVMHLISDFVGKALGPAASALGIAGDALGTASGLIADAQNKAKQAQAFAKNVEDKAGELVKRLSSVKIGIGDTGDLSQIEDAADALEKAVKADPFAGGAPGGKGKGDDDAAARAVFPANRKTMGRGKPIDDAAFASVLPKLKWAEARDEQASAPGTTGAAK